MFREIHDVERIHIYKAEEAITFVKNVKNKKLVIFCDYEFFDENKNGLHILENSPMDAIKILVTSHLYDPTIMKETIHKGFKILPKDLVPFFKLWNSKCKTLEKQINFIFIDDDRRNTQSWELFAEAKNLKIITYNKVNEFIMNVDQFNRNIPIYIDLDLGEEKSGIDYAKDIYDLGFKEIYIATGAINFDIKSTEKPWITKIIEKRFPLI